MMMMMKIGLYLLSDEYMNVRESGPNKAINLPVDTVIFVICDMLNTRQSLFHDIDKNPFFHCLNKESINSRRQTKFSIGLNTVCLGKKRHPFIYL